MTTRPHFNSSTAELETLAKASWNSPATLKGILHELSHRSTPKAERLERDILQRLDTNPAGTAGGSAPAGDDAALAAAVTRAAAAEVRVRELTGEVSRLRAEVAKSRNGSGYDPLHVSFARVGLHPDCPDFVLKAVHRAFRREYHPDALSDRPHDEQLRAQANFQQYEVVFRELNKVRA